MKKSDIEVGKKYSDGKGNVRLVTGMGPQYVSYPGQANTECLKYRLVEKKSGPYRVGSEVCCTLISFARWAKHWKRG